MPPKFFKLVLAACAALVVPALAACGDDNNDSKQEFGASVGSGESAITKTEFLAQANQICGEGNKQLDAAGQKLGSNPSRDEVTSFATDSVVPLVEKEIADIRALGAPAGDEDQVNAILDAAQADTDKIKADPSSLAGNGDPYADANKLADDYGLSACGSGDDESGGGGGATTTTPGTGAGATTGTGTTGSGGYAAPGTDSDGNGIPDPSN